MEDRTLYISLEEAVNNVGDRQFMSKAEREVMYREWGGLGGKGTVLFDDQQHITGFRPDSVIEEASVTITIDPVSGQVDYV